MTGHVDEPADRTVAEVGIGETQVDRHTARALFRQPVRLDTRQRFYKHRLTVIDMSRCRDDHEAELDSCDN